MTAEFDLIINITYKDMNSVLPKADSVIEYAKILSGVSSQFYQFGYSVTSSDTNVQGKTLPNVIVEHYSYSKNRGEVTTSAKLNITVLADASQEADIKISLDGKDYDLIADALDAIHNILYTVECEVEEAKESEEVEA